MYVWVNIINRIGQLLEITKIVCLLEISSKCSVYQDIEDRIVFR